MAKIDRNLSSYLDFVCMVSNFLHGVKMADKKIEKLKLKMITNQKKNKQRKDDHNDVINYKKSYKKTKIRNQEFYNLNYNHSLLKRGFIRTIMIFSRLLDPQDSHEDYYYTNSQIFLHQLHNLLPLRKAKTNDEFLLVMQEIRSSWIKNAKIRDRKIKKLARALKVGINSYDDDHEGVEKNKWTMIDVMKKMYGFANLEKAKNEEKIIRKLKEVELSTLCLSTYCELLSPEIDDILRRKKSNLGEFLKLMNGIRNSSELDVEIEEANRELLWWLYYVEREIFLLVNDLTFVNNKCPLIGLIRKLKELKQQEQGKVALVVYRILFLLEEKMKVDHKGLYMDKVEFGYLVLQLYKMILLCTHVLNNISNLNSNNRNLLVLENVCNYSKKEVFIESFELVRKCDEKISAMRREVDEFIRS